MHLRLALAVLMLGPVARLAFAQEIPGLLPQPIAAWPDTLVIDLEPQPEHGPFLGGVGMGGLSGQQEDTSSAWYGIREEVTGIPDSLPDATPYFHDFDFAQLTYQAYRHGRITPEHALSAFASWGTDTLQFTPEWVDGRVAVLIAKTDSQYVFIFDTDNDERFAGEEAVTLPLDPPEDQMARMYAGAERAVSYEFYDGKQVRTGEALLRVNPWIKGPPGMGDIYLAGVHQHFAGVTLSPAGDTLRWFASRGTRDRRFRPENTAVILLTGADGEPPTVKDGYEPYRTGEVLDLGGATYRLEHVTPGGERLVLSRAPEALVGLRTGMEAPDVAALTLAGDSLRLSDLRGRHVLLEFWGTWCGPCLGEVPNLKEAYAAYGADRLEIVGVANDDAQAVSDFVAEHEMAWPQIVQDADEDRAVLDAFRIQGYPTTLLLGPDGRIVAREHLLRGPGLMRTLRQHLEEPPSAAEE